MQDCDLIEKLHREPDAGMKILIEQYAGLVYAVVKSKMSASVFCDTDIEICVADTFSEFYFDIEKYNPDFGSIKSWLCTIAKHNALDYIRKNHKSADTISLDAEDSINQYADDFSIEGNFENADFRRKLMFEIKNLGKPDSEIIIRKYYLNQTSKEIAEKMNMTVANIDTRTHRAIKKLRTKFGGYNS